MVPIDLPQFPVRPCMFFVQQSVVSQAITPRKSLFGGEDDFGKQKKKCYSHLTDTESVWS
jgi:hypothetical protein